MALVEHTPGPWTVRKSKVPHDGEYDFGISAAGVPVLAEAFGLDANGQKTRAEALAWVRKNYASGSTREINDRIDAAINAASLPLASKETTDV